MASTARCRRAAPRLHPRFRTPWVGIVGVGVAVIGSCSCCRGRRTCSGRSTRSARCSRSRWRTRRRAAAREAAGHTAALSRAGQRPDRQLRRARCSRWWAGRHGDRVRRHRDAESEGRGDRHGVAARRHRRLRRLPASPGARPHLHPQGRDPAAGAVDHEAEYDSVLVMSATSTTEQVIATAVKLAARKRHGIHVLVTITVPNSRDIGASMPAEESAADSIIEQAKLQGGGRVSGHWRSCAPARPGGASSRRPRTCARRPSCSRCRSAFRARRCFGKTLETVWPSGRAA